jgi:hypothetical protein
MSTIAPSRAFIADSLGSIELVPADDPRNLDLGATQPIDIPLDTCLSAAASSL